jgi:uncharacterized phage-like protein YoqJ
MTDLVVAITGIRDIDPSMTDLVTRTLVEMVAAGATEFVFGGALGLDTMALEAACELAVRRFVIVPFSILEQPRTARIAIETCADHVVELCRPMNPRAWIERNVAMLAAADHVLAFTDGRTTGGTAFMIEKAKERNLPLSVITVAPRRR